MAPRKRALLSDPQIPQQASNEPEERALKEGRKDKTEKKEKKAKKENQ